MMTLARLKPGLTSILLTAAAIALCAHSLWAQRVAGRSERPQPAWVTGGMESGNSTFSYMVVKDEGKNLEPLKAGRLNSLASYLEQSNNITGTISKDVQLESSIAKGFDQTTTYQLSFQTEPQVVRFSSKMVDDYWEYVVYPDGSQMYAYYVLYAVSNSANPHFDDVSFSRKYGAHGLWRSTIVPGWGQMHKGSTVKGVVILVGEAALIGTTVYLESMRSDNFRKSQETTNLTIIKEFRNRADSWALYRNVALGAAIGLYAYNLVDAIVAPGAKRVIVKRYAFAPVVTPEYAGVGVMIRF
jgi:hypothetical protein